MSCYPPGPWRAYGARIKCIDHGVEYTVARVETRRLNEDGIKGTAAILSAAPEMLNVLVQAIEASGFSLSGPTDSRAAEHDEPAWVCNARAVIAKAR
jgi:hypothetical protein